MTRDYAAAVRAGDVIDFCDRIWTNAFGTGLGGPDGDPSPSVSALRAPSLLQEQPREPGDANNAPGRNS
jgi:hypothetical protein